MRAGEDGGQFLWSAVNPEHAGGSLATADIIDAQLHRERITDEYYQRDKRKRVYLENIAALPDWCFVVFGAELIPNLVYGSHIYPWSAEGYGLPRSRPVDGLVAVLTPHSTVRALEHGYQPQIHSQANLCSC